MVDPKDIFNGDMPDFMNDLFGSFEPPKPPKYDCNLCMYRTSCDRVVCIMEKLETKEKK